MKFGVALFATQSFMPLYLKLYEGNFLDQPPEPTNAYLIMLFMALQLLIIKR